MKPNQSGEHVGQDAFLPLRFERGEVYEESARILNKTLADHEGYLRENSGDWIILSAEGVGLITVRFQGKAKRGQTWNAPDPQGQALARYVTRACNNYPALVEALRGLMFLTEPHVCTRAETEQMNHCRALLQSLGETNK